MGKEEEQAVLRVIRSGQIAQGPKVCEFESLMAQYIGKKFAIAVSSGLAALHLSLLGLDIKEGDRVVVPTYTCDALLQAISYVKAKPIIVDGDYGNGNLTYENCCQALTEIPKAIIVTHNFGFPADLTKLLNLNIPLIEDCAVSVGGGYHGKKLGSFGKVSIFSFYATKMMACGEGGMVLTDDPDIANKLKELRDYTKNITFRERYNYKMTDMEATIGICQLKKIDHFIEQRKLIFEEYSKLLANVKEVILPNYDSEDKTYAPSFFRFIIKLRNIDTSLILDGMRKRGIICGRGVLIPLHKLLKLDNDKYPNSEKLYTEAISLPIYPSLKLREISMIVDAFMEMLRASK